MSAQHNLDLIHGMYEALNAQDLDAQDKYWAKDMIWHGPPEFGDIHGLEGFKYQVLKPFYKAFPDYYVENDIEVADENWASATGFLTGHHQGEFLGIPPTGKPVKFRFSDFWLIKDGLLSENWVMTDDFALLKQMGVDPMAGLKS
ncbi:MAG: ester cyclase [Anaerolineae bacterium]|nr:ester cyclase [Anaerolineae bacterium]